MESENYTLIEAYETSKNAGNTGLNFEEIIWDKDVEPIVSTLRKAGIKEFTISVRQGNMLDLLTAFQELGVFIKGMVKVNTRFEKIVPAALMQIA